MVLAVDIENSVITLGGFRADELVFTASVTADTDKTSDEYAALIRSVLSLRGVLQEDIEGAIIASVVPVLTSVIKNSIELIYGIRALTVSPGIKTGISIHCDTPSSVGADLICASVGAKELYGSPALIVDMGIATKIIYVDSKGTFSGVSIMPGVPIGSKGLYEMTAQLPQVSLDAPPSVIGKNTADSMRSGLIFGHAGAVDGMIKRIWESVGEQLPVIATGEYAPLIAPHCSTEMKHDENLVLRGLNRIYAKNC